MHRIVITLIVFAVSACAAPPAQDPAESAIEQHAYCDNHPRCQPATCGVLVDSRGAPYLHCVSFNTCLSACDSVTAECPWFDDAGNEEYGCGLKCGGSGPALSFLTCYAKCLSDIRHVCLDDSIER